MAEIEKGPWFGANYPGKCTTCEDRFDEGDRIRADGEGGWECENCDLDDPIAVVGLAEDPSQQVPSAADEFLFADPTPQASAKPEPNVSGQPADRRDWMGRYIVVDPDLGDFRRSKQGKPQGITRATTFNKAASDKGNIADWNRCNVLMGATLRPDIVAKAHGLTWDTDKDTLKRLAAELETAAGAKVSAEIGTFLHDFTERMDAGLVTCRDAPPQYQLQLALYSQALTEAGLEPVSGLIERVTMIREFGGVVGKFDRIFYHRPSGSYMIGDLKTGKSMEFAMQETETQLWTYAHGVNQNGVYDWNTDTWCPAWDDHENRDQKPVRVREDVGVIIHMPVQGPDAGKVMLDHADLVAGAAHAELCHANRSKPKAKVRPFEPPKGVIDFSVIDPTPWEVLFSQVRNQAEARDLYNRACAAGIRGDELKTLVATGWKALKASSGEG